MTYDQLYEHIVKYVASPHTTITEHDKKRACLILDNQNMPEGKKWVNADCPLHGKVR